VAYSLPELRSYTESDLSLTLVAEDEQGNVGGFILVQLEPLTRRCPNGSFARRLSHIITIDVLPEYRCCGTGTKLLQLTEQWLEQHGADIVFLETATDNEPAISFYRKNGYTLLNLLKDYYSRGADAYLMGKRIHH